MAQTTLIAATTAAATSLPGVDFTVTYATPATVCVFNADATSPTGDLTQDLQITIEQKMPAGAVPAYVPLYCEKEQRVEAGLYQRQVVVYASGTYRVNKPATTYNVGVALDQ